MIGRNYKQDFVRMMDDVYKKSQSIMYVGDKENANTDSALRFDEKEPYFNQFNKELYQKFFPHDGGNTGVQGRLYLHS